jgi:DNA adenine methylase
LIYQSTNPDPLELGFAALFLNRTNRSGILTGGPIGGYDQAGDWRLDVRFRRGDLARRLEKIARHRSRIRLHGIDASEFLGKVVPGLPDRCLIYLDPPYYLKGQEQLYANWYRPEDHREVARLVRSLDRPWVVSYDDVIPIRALYEGEANMAYGIPYAAHTKYRGREIAFFSGSLAVPSVSNPTRLSAAEKAFASSAQRS